MARRSIALAAADPELLTENWLLIANIKYLDGDESARAEALREARRYSKPVSE
jgi:hypothetical protein